MEWHQLRSHNQPNSRRSCNRRSSLQHCQMRPTGKIIRGHNDQRDGQHWKHLWFEPKKCVALQIHDKAGHWGEESRWALEWNRFQWKYWQDVLGGQLWVECQGVWLRSEYWKYLWDFLVNFKFPTSLNLSILQPTRRSSAIYQHTGKSCKMFLLVWSLIFVAIFTSPCLEAAASWR